jgi:hypothetical protein
MRYYILKMSDGVLPAFIAAECVDEFWARDELRLAHDRAVLSEEEMLLDEELAPILTAWKARNDTAWAAWEADYEIDSVLDQAQHPDSGRDSNRDLPRFEDYYRPWLEELDGDRRLGGRLGSRPPFGSRRSPRCRSLLLRGLGRLATPGRYRASPWRGRVG